MKNNRRLIVFEDEVIGEYPEPNVSSGETDYGIGQGDYPPNEGEILDYPESDLSTDPDAYDDVVFESEEHDGITEVDTNIPVMITGLELDFTSSSVDTYDQHENYEDEIIDIDNVDDEEIEELVPNIEVSSEPGDDIIDIDYDEDIYDESLEPDEEKNYAPNEGEILDYPEPDWRDKSYLDIEFERRSSKRLDNKKVKKERKIDTLKRIKKEAAGDDIDLAAQGLGQVISVNGWDFRYNYDRSVMELIDPDDDTVIDTASLQKDNYEDDPKGWAQKYADILDNEISAVDLTEFEDGIPSDE